LFPPSRPIEDYQPENSATWKKPSSGFFKNESMRPSSFYCLNLRLICSNTL
jgi:hypothetical protein